MGEQFAQSALRLSARGHWHVQSPTHAAHTAHRALDLYPFTFSLCGSKLKRIELKGRPPEGARPCQVCRARIGAKRWNELAGQREARP